MEIDHYIAISAVVIGWLLSEASSLFRATRENRKYISSAITALLYLYIEQCKINDFLTFLNQRMKEDLDNVFNYAKENEACSIKELLSLYVNHYEDQRRFGSTLPEKNIENLIKLTINAVDGLSKADAKNAYKANKAINDFILFTEIEFPKGADNHNLFVPFSESILSIFRNEMKSLKWLILWLSYKNGVLSFYRIYFLIRKEEKKINRSSDRSLQRLTTSLTKHSSGTTKKQVAP
ncbi:MAG: hypothetical protein JXQ68_07220 [Campylobacterales bacterium]|nr:hypothetical protein [Campylobacterales bacterium]